MTLFSDFCCEFGVEEEDLGIVVHSARRCFLVRAGDEKLVTKDVFGMGIFLGEEKSKFEPSPALLELLASKTQDHKVVVDERAAWLFLCGRDILDEGTLSMGEPTKNGLFFVQNEFDENIGYGGRKRGMVVKNLLDRGFYLRRER